MHLQCATPGKSRKDNPRQRLRRFCPPLQIQSPDLTEVMGSKRLPKRPRQGPWSFLGLGDTKSASEGAVWRPCKFTSPWLWPAMAGIHVDFSGLPPETCGMWRISARIPLLTADTNANDPRGAGPDREGEKAMAEEKPPSACTTTDRHRRYPLRRPEVLPSPKRTAAMALHQWTLQFLISVIKKSRQRSPSQQNE